MILTIILAYLAFAVAWTVGWLAFYFVFEAKHDGSGDGGLAYMFISSLSWIWPWLLYSILRDKMSRPSQTG